MTVSITLSAASSNLRDYLDNVWHNDFGYNGNGAFYGTGGADGVTVPWSEWGAGVSGAGSHGVELDGTLYYPPGGGGLNTSTSYIDTLTFGDNYTDAGGPGPFSVTSDLVVNFGHVHPDDQFNEAIYALSHGGHLEGADFVFDPSAPAVHFDGIYDYFTSQGTNITGTNGADVITAWDGADTINGGNGADTINGAGGNDTINGGSGNDVIAGGNGDDTINGGNQSDTIDGGNGVDHINGGANADIISGGAGNDTLTGGNDNDTFAFYTGSDHDTITDLAGGDTISVFGHWDGVTGFSDLALANAVGGGVDVTSHVSGTDSIHVDGYTVATLTSGFFS